jgi:orotidine-5'-phosphate decarboxylase
MNFADRLIEAICQKKTRLVVGLDPHLELLPPSMMNGVSRNNRVQLADVIARFCIGVIESVGDLVAAVKPQVAFFERLGGAGYDALEKVTAEARDRNLLIISDAKRGDIGSTAQAYADYHLGVAQPSSEHELQCLGADAITLNPYLGEDSLQPFLRHVEKGRGLFLLAKTSNVGSANFQDRMISDDQQAVPLYHAVAHLADMLVSRYPAGKHGYSSVGLVVGATFPEQAAALRSAFPRLLFLVPGVGAQGARPSDLRGCFDPEGLGAVINASRSVIFAYRDSGGGANWQAAARQAARDLRDEINSSVTRG